MENVSTNVGLAMLLIHFPRRGVFWENHFNVFGISSPSIFTHSPRSTIVGEVERMRKAGLASMAYFFFSFRDAQKQHRCDLLSLRYRGCLSRRA